jgi:pimeloyl-ACP methyl ester carboxylesterase
MNLEGWLDAVEATGRQLGLLSLHVTFGSVDQQFHLTFLQPLNPNKTPVVLIHGLMSTPRMWKAVLEGLLADAEIRMHYQFWFFYYPTGQPVPFSAFQLRQVLTDASSRYHLSQPLVLIGHSMGGVIARAHGFRPTKPNGFCRRSVACRVTVRQETPLFLNLEPMSQGSSL